VLQAQPDQAEARFLLGSALLQTGDPGGAETELRRALASRYARDAVLPALARALLAQGKGKKLLEEFASVHLVRPAAQADLQLSLSRAYAQQNSAAPAEAALSTALSTAPAYPQVQLEHARQLALHHDYANAQTVLDALISIEPASLDAWKLKGDIYGLDHKQAAEAEAAYCTALAIKPDYLEVQAALVQLLLLQQQPDAAAKEFAQLQKIAPDSPRTLFLASQLAFNKKDYKLAEERVQRLLSAAPDNVQGLQPAGTIEMQLKHLQQAQTFLARAVDLSPKHDQARKLLVLVYLQQQQPAKALEALLPGLNNSPDDPDTTALAGEVYLQNGDLTRAEQYFNQSRQQRPDNVRVKTALAMVDMLRNPGPNSVDKLRSIAATDAGTDTDMLLIGALVRQRQFDQALKALDAVEKKQPNQAVTAYLRAQVQLGQKDLPAARASLQHAVTLQANYFPAINSLAALDLADKRPQEARKRYETLLKAEPKNVLALLGLAEVAAMGGAPAAEVLKLVGNAVAADPGNREARLALIELHLRNKDPGKALQAAQNAATALPDDGQILDALGRSQRAAGDDNQAITTFHKLTELNPKSPLPYWRIAEIQMGSNDKSAAIQSLQQAIAVQPGFVEGQRALATLYLADKRLGDAQALAQGMQKQNPKLDSGYLLEAEVLRRNENWKKAQAVLQTGLQQAGSTPLAIAMQAVLLASGQGAQAGRFATQWQQDHPKDAAFIFNLGDQALARKDYGGAEQLYLAVLKLQPENAAVLNNLAWVGSKLNRKEAMGYAEKAVALAPGQPAFLDTLATLRADKGDYKQALELQNRALALQPQNPQFKLNLVRIQYRSGQKELARKQLDELTDMGETFPAQDAVLALRKELSLP
jgi:putative PEP-CTERM system TPR-repeat lipoprotein